MVIEPKIGIGGGGTSSDPTYRSTGAQLPFDGSASQNNVQVCGGTTIWFPMSGAGAVKIGVDAQACSGPSAFGGGDETLFRILRHGPGGDVLLQSRTNVIFDVFARAEVPVAPKGDHLVSPEWLISAAIGPTFRQRDLTLTSNQSFFGGGIPQAASSTWQTGVGVAAGISTFVCPDCIAGNPLKVGVEGRVRFFPSQSIDLTSPAFGFTETGSTGSTVDYSAMFNFSVPINTAR